LRGKQILLLVDGPGSRINSAAIEYLLLNGIILITLLAHTSHLLEPFDVGLAVPTKSNIRKLLTPQNSWVISPISTFHRNKPHDYKL
jgi:hypothetical protein